VTVTPTILHKGCILPIQCLLHVFFKLLSHSIQKITTNGLPGWRLVSRAKQCYGFDELGVLNNIDGNIAGVETPG
jgi:hypothetical protein